MQQISFDEIRNMKGLGSSMRMILKLFIDKGAKIQIIHEQLEPNERYFIVELEDLKIPLRSAKLNFYSVFNSLFAQTITVDKLKTFSFLKANQLPTPDTVLYKDSKRAREFLQKNNPIVVKPLDGAHGEGITTNVTSEAALATAITAAQSVNSQVLLQQQVVGDDYRLLFVDYEFVAAVKRTPATIVGDGNHNIQQLVEASNEKMAKLWAEIREGKVNDSDIKGSVSKTPIEEIVLARGKDFLNRVPKQGEEIQLLDKANVSLGGQTEDVTELVSKELTNTITNFLRTIDLPLCGVDVIAQDISAPVHKSSSYIIELNAAPGLRLHEHPTIGQSRAVCELVVEKLTEYYKVLQKSNNPGIITPDFTDNR